MPDHSNLDSKYFVDRKTYNCPFCNRRNVKYTLQSHREFDWSNNKECHCYFVDCSSCNKRSFHLSYEKIHEYSGTAHFKTDIEIDEHIFYSVPTSFFVLDNRIPKVLRELIVEAQGCLKMNFLTGASACTRKAIYEFLILNDAEGDNYDEKIKDLKSNFDQIDKELFDILGHIKDLTSDKVHEESWEKWDAQHIRLFLETLRAILKDVYVVPDERKKRSSNIQKLLSKVKGSNKKSSD
ncbi:MAG: hypothetical protein ACQETL_19655 [Bacteroidota bacterium]